MRCSLWTQYSTCRPDRASTLNLLADELHRYVYLVELAGGIIRYVPIPPPAGADSAVKSGDEWTVDIQGLGDAISSED